jgi:hypothetical protein
MRASDREIRAALHRKKFGALHGRTDTVIVDELGLAHAKARIDIAVINGFVHGFEIKSATDTTSIPNVQHFVESQAGIEGSQDRSLRLNIYDCAALAHQPMRRAPPF